MKRPSAWAGRRVLVTGHTGFKGSWLCLLLHRLGAHVAGYSDRIPTQPSHFDLAGVGQYLTDDFRNDIRDSESLSAAFDRFAPDVVFHMAAQPLVRAGLLAPIETYGVNVMGTVNCLEAARHSATVRAAIIITSDKVYADQNWAFGYRENDPLGGADPYSGSKACAEFVVSTYRQAYGLDGSGKGCVAVSARAGNVVGGGDFSQDRLVPDLVRAIESEAPLVLRYPFATRPWQHVLEPLLGYLRLAEAVMDRRTTENAWNFGPPAAQTVSVGEFVSRLADCWGARLPVQITDVVQPKETNTLQVDSTKAAVRLGWHPAITFDRTLELTAEWYKAYLRGDDMAEVSRRQIEDILAAQATIL
ncbi:CDP-glucose 4,6-dehydratase [Hyphomicrobium sp. D-2]|uniref:CDP-glucose 4,6-dehydratase n=1 Tax=Hyphomicrobium sp. D-2 TaxID=3041621 RepID=UPI002455631E|nr:CDP-glucose 4,6-dehydratase [Hyphomicrobium sp. D-2]MDH4981858.1 CDP-glucose 4,6-dehydratase [Hyphomicrobium sp. D-2]